MRKRLVIIAAVNVVANQTSSPARGLTSARLLSQNSMSIRLIWKSPRARACLSCCSDTRSFFATGRRKARTAGRMLALFVDSAALQGLCSPRQPNRKSGLRRER